MGFNSAFKGLKMSVRTNQAVYGFASQKKKDCVPSHSLEEIKYETYCLPQSYLRSFFRQ